MSTGEDDEIIPGTSPLVNLDSPHKSLMTLPPCYLITSQLVAPPSPLSMCNLHCVGRHLSKIQLWLLRHIRLKIAVKIANLNTWTWPKEWNLGAKICSSDCIDSVTVLKTIDLC